MPSSFIIPPLTDTLISGLVSFSSVPCAITGAGSASSFFYFFRSRCSRGILDQDLNKYDLILKSPGVNFNNINYFIPKEKFISQAELFLMAYGENVIGVTGTKGKSTTASLIYHILSNTVGDTVLAGNIGIPFFDIIERITDDTTIVAELSAHQLEYTDFSPHIAILLNLYQEHLDHFNTFNNYQQGQPGGSVLSTFQVTSRKPLC